MTRLPLPAVAILSLAALLSACGGGGSAPSLTAPTPASHARFFPIAEGDAHGPAAGQAVVDCDACHQDKTTRTPSASFTTFTCTGCHVPAPVLFHDDLQALTTLHQGSPAVAEITQRTGQPFDTLDASCRACHPQGIRDAVDHALHFPLPHGDGAGLAVAACAECHVQRTSGRYLVMGCASCHPHDLAATATAHAQVPDFLGVTAGSTPAEKEAASGRCVRCHGDGVVPVRLVGHAAVANGFPVGGSSVHTGPGARCLDCHPALRSDPGKTLAADFQVTSCIGCHDLVGPTDVDHGSRTELETYHLAAVDKVTGQPVPKARLFTQVVGEAIVKAGGDAARGLSAACLQCHPQGRGEHPYYLIPHQNAAGTVVAGCDDCHVSTARKADLGCASCHATRSPVGSKHAKVPDVVASDTSLAASALCARCHEYDAIPTRVATGHAGFPIASGKHSGTAGGTCLACHPALKGEPTPWAADFEQTDCTGCHVPVAGGLAQHDDWASLTPLHVGAKDYPATQPTVAAFAAACRSCHPSGAAGPPADHGEYFDLSASSTHVFPSARIAVCLDCHTSSSRLNPADFRCAACHAADRVALATGHAAVPDFAADPTNPVKCLACHADGRLPATAAKVTVTVKGHPLAAGGFVIGAGSHSGTAGGACLTCHPANRAPSSTPPHWDYARDFKQVTCLGCHVPVGGGRAQHDDPATLATLHATTANYATTVASRGPNAACLYCHADGAGAAPANHPELFPIGVGTKHTGLSCAACHTNPANRKDLTAFACASCHAGPTVAKSMAAAHTVTGYAITSYRTATTAGGTRTTVQVDMTKSASCLRCHASSQVDRIANHTRSDSGFGKGDHRPAGCFTCHSRMRTDKPWGADFKEAKGALGPPPSGCYVCHRSGRG